MCGIRNLTEIRIVVDIGTYLSIYHTDTVQSVEKHLPYFKVNMHYYLLNTIIPNVLMF